MDNLYGNYNDNGDLVGVFRNSGDTGPFQATDSELEACCCGTTTTEAAPSSCPYADTSEGPDRLRVVNYTDGDIPASNCGDCLSNTGTEWDGTMSERVSTCGWAPTFGYDEIDGKYFYSDDSGVSLDSNGWHFWLSCYTSSTIIEFYVAYKTTGDTPEGTYTVEASESCISTPTTVDIESY